LEIGLALNTVLANWFKNVNTNKSAKDYCQRAENIEKLQNSLMLSAMIYRAEMVTILRFTNPQAYILRQISVDPLLHFAFWMCVLQGTR